MDYKPHLYKRDILLVISAIGFVFLPANISAQIPSMVRVGNCPTVIPSICSALPTAIPMTTLWQITTVPLPSSFVHTQSDPTNTPTIPFQPVHISNATATDVTHARKIRNCPTNIPWTQPTCTQHSSSQSASIIPTNTLPSASSSDSIISSALSDPSPSGQVPTGTHASACMSPKDNLFQNPFNKDSAHHRPIGTGAVYASDNAAATVDWLRASGINLNVGTRYGDIIFENKESDPLTTIGCDTTWRKPCNGTPVNLRMPTGITGSTDTDAAANVYEASTGILHEFYRFYTTGDVYRAGVHRANPIRGLGHAAPGTNERGSGITASGMSIFTGLLRGHEVNTPGYKIQHALNVIVTSHPGTCTIPMAKNAYVWPAGGTDWFCGGANCIGNIPYGALLAIPPESKGGPNLDSLDLSEPGKRVAEALRDYGMYMTDTGGCVAMRTDQFINSTVENQVRTDLEKVYNYVRMVENGGTGPVAGGGDPLAPNCAFDAQ